MALAAVPAAHRSANAGQRNAQMFTRHSKRLPDDEAAHSIATV